LAAKKASISSLKSIDSSVSKIISEHQQTMTAGELAPFLEKEVVVSEITILISDKLCDRIYHPVEVVRPFPYFWMF
jgi:hypothetical protein